MAATPINIAVISRKHIQTYRETITPGSRDQVISLLEMLLSIARNDRVTGRIHMDLIGGGVRAIHVERVEEKPAI